MTTPLYSRYRGVCDRLSDGLRRFFFAPASPRPLAALRIAVAAVLLVQAFLVRSELTSLFASDGYVQAALNQYLAVPTSPKLGWILPWLARLGLDERAGIELVCGLYVASVGAVGLGLFTRASTVAAWLLHWTLMSTADTTNYGADLYAHVFLFYMIVAPTGAAWSLDLRRRRARERPSEMARFSLRLMQLHLCVTYLASGLEKASGAQWWNGELLWRALQLPVYRQVDMSWLAQWPALSTVGGWATLAFELGYCVFIWPRRTRPLWVAAMVSLHLGIAVFLGLGVFGVIMASLTAALFGVSAAPRGREGGATAGRRRRDEADAGAWAVAGAG